jgi:hypothetical protein
VFLLHYGSVTARQAKVTCNDGESFADTAEEMFKTVLDGAVDEHLRPVYEARCAALAAMRSRRDTRNS